MDVVIRAALMYFFLLFLTRVVGRRELSSLEPFDLILLIVLGDLIQQGVTQSDYSFTGLMLAAGTIAIMQTSVSWIGYRSPRKAGLVLEGEMKLTVDAESWTLKTGDSFRFASRRPHRFSNPSGKAKAVVLWVNCVSAQ